LEKTTWVRSSWAKRPRGTSSAIDQSNSALMKASLPSFTRPSGSGRQTCVRLDLRAIVRQSGASVRCSLGIKSKGGSSTQQRLLALPILPSQANALSYLLTGVFGTAAPVVATPKTNSEYWSAKIARNKERDKRNTRQLRKKGFKVIRIWECALRKNPLGSLKRIQETLGICAESS
jgi:DNA mismatch endonuclease Vsr